MQLFFSAPFSIVLVKIKGAYIKYVGGEPEGFTNFPKKNS